MVLFTNESQISPERKHARAIVDKLTDRPLKTDDEGYHDYVEDEKQMIDIVEKYLQKNLNQ
jgi:hypothetical protein